MVGCRLDIDSTLVVPNLPQIDPSDAEKLHGLSLKMSTEEVMTWNGMEWKAIAGDAKCAGPELNFFMT